MMNIIKSATKGPGWYEDPVHHILSNDQTTQVLCTSEHQHDDYTSTALIPTAIFKTHSKIAVITGSTKRMLLKLLSVK